jgi:hypothetical protein
MIGQTIGRTWRSGLVGLLVLALAAPLPALGAGPSLAGASLGTARGLRSAEVSLDGGVRWLPAGGRSLPLVDGARIRSASGAVRLDLADGSRINVLPFSAVRIAQAGGATAIVLDRGRLTFRLPRDTRVAIETPAARLEPVRTEVMVGEVFAGETTGLKMTRGNLQVRDLSRGAPVLVASLEPVFVPKPPAIAGPLFTSDVPNEIVPNGAKGVFSAKGESLGYLQPDGRFVVHPGFAADLTGPFPPKTVQVAMATIPAKSRADVEPLFDVNGGYVGYVAGPLFYYAQARGAQVKGAPAAPAEKEPTAGAEDVVLAPARWWDYAVAAAVIVGSGVAMAAGVGTFDEEEGPAVTPATPVTP